MKIERRQTKLLVGSGVKRETAFGSSFTFSGGVSVSLAFPLSFFLGLPRMLGGGGSTRLMDEFERDIDGSLSIVPEDESGSMTIG